MVGNVSVGAGVPVSVAYDHAKALVLITNEDTNNVSAINDSTNQGTANFFVGANPVGVVYNPAVVSAYVSNYVQGTLTILSPGPPTSYNITFTETGLPSGTMWGADLDGIGNSSATTTVGFTDPNGTYPYAITPVAGFTAHPSTGNLTISGAAAARTIVFLPVPTYNATFVETGLPLGTNWSLSLNGTPGSSNTSAINFTLPNGTYAFAVGPIIGFQVSPSQGNVSIVGSNVSQALTFLPIPTYSVTFNEAGLPSGTSWGVTLNGTTTSSTASSIVFVESNGTYPFSLAAVAGYTGNQTSGEVVVMGLNVSEGITFVPAVPVITQYSVTFTETGLSSGTSWGLTLNGSTRSSTITTVSFSEPNGTYAYSVLAVTGFDANLSTGDLRVDGANVSLTIALRRGHERHLYGDLHRDRVTIRDHLDGDPGGDGPQLDHERPDLHRTERDLLLRGGSPGGIHLEPSLWVDHGPRSARSPIGRVPVRCETHERWLGLRDVPGTPPGRGVRRPRWDRRCGDRRCRGRAPAPSPWKDVGRPNEQCPATGRRRAPGPT